MTLAFMQRQIAKKTKQKDTPRYYKTAAPQGFGRGKKIFLRFYYGIRVLLRENKDLTVKGSPNALDRFSSLQNQKSHSKHMAHPVSDKTSKGFEMFIFQLSNCSLNMQSKAYNLFELGFQNSLDSIAICALITALLTN